MIFSLLAGSFLACGDKESNTEEEVATECTVAVDDTFPISGAADMQIQKSVIFTLSEEDASADITIDGVAGTTTVDGEDVIFTPDGLLAPSTSYTATVTYCDGASSTSIDFTTSSLGEPLEGSVAGNTYAVDIASGEFVQPAGIGSLIGDALTNNILLGIVDDSGGQLQVIGAISEDGNTNQDMCTETLEDFPAADFSDSPYFEIPEGDVTISVAGITATIYRLNVTGIFAPDGSYFAAGELRGELDARDLVSVVGELGLDVETADDICALVMGFGVTCEPCGDGEPYCVGLEVVNLEADATGSELVSVTAEDVANDPSCPQE